MGAKQVQTCQPDRNQGTAPVTESFGQTRVVGLCAGRCGLSRINRAGVSGRARCRGANAPSLPTDGASPYPRDPSAQSEEQLLRPSSRAPLSQSTFRIQSSPRSSRAKASNWWAYGYGMLGKSEPKRMRSAMAASRGT